MDLTRENQKVVLPQQMDFSTVTNKATGGEDTVPSVKPDSSEPVENSTKPNQFNESELVQIHEKEADTKDYRTMFWERVALDAQRFVERISRAEKDLGHILSNEHKHKIYNDYISTARQKRQQCESVHGTNV